MIEKIFFPDSALEFLKKEIPNTGGVLDNWSFVHFISGMLTKKIITKNRFISLGLFAAVELYERKLVNEGKITMEKFSNSLGDIIIAQLGFELVK